MRLVTFDDGSGPRAGVPPRRGGRPRVRPGCAGRLGPGPARGPGRGGLAELGRRAQDGRERLRCPQCACSPPVTDPEKIICLGLNYRDHAEETGQEIPAAPLWFGKFANSLTAAARTSSCRRPPRLVDYEAELAVVIGRTANRVQEADALSYVAGAMPFNDVSARDLQLQNPLWTSGKAVDTFAPCGPALVTLEEVRDLGTLGLRTRINGRVVQEGNTANLIFSVAIGRLAVADDHAPARRHHRHRHARGLGGPQGIFLRDGDTVEVEIDGLGVLANPVRRQ